MPLVLISGYPVSGKSHRARQLADFFAATIANSTDARVRKLRVHVVDDDGLGLSREVYRHARAEKDARAAAYSAVKRLLSRDDIVIADGLNYIKGFRYQLYCEAKAVQTPSCVVHVGTSIEKCRELHRRRREEEEEKQRMNSSGDGDANSNAAGTSSDGGSSSGSVYADDVFENLIFRYEEPNGMNRWDSPLFVVAFDDDRPPEEAIWDALVGSEGQVKVVRPNQATVLKPATEQNYLYELDKTTSDVLAEIRAWQQDHPGEGGGLVPIAGAAVPVTLPAAAPVTLPQLQRVRRQFIALNRQHALSKQRIRDVFVEYLNDNFL